MLLNYFLKKHCLLLLLSFIFFAEYLAADFKIIVNRRQIKALKVLEASTFLNCLSVPTQVFVILLAYY